MSPIVRVFLVLFIVLNIGLFVAIAIINKKEKKTSENTNSSVRVIPSVTPVPLKDVKTAYETEWKIDNKGYKHLNGKVTDRDEKVFRVQVDQAPYNITVLPKSYVECRDKYITTPQGLVPANTMFYDLSHYISSLLANGDDFVKKGKLFYYKDAYQKIQPGVDVTALVYERDYTLPSVYHRDLIAVLVYGCE